MVFRESIRNFFFEWKIGYFQREQKSSLFGGIIKKNYLEKFFQYIEPTRMVYLFMSLKTLCLHLIHENTSIHRSALSLCSRPRDLRFYLIIKIKKIIFQSKLCHLQEVLCRSFFFCSSLSSASFIALSLTLWGMLG